MKRKILFLVLLGAVSMGSGLKEQLEQYEPSDSNERAAQVVVPDTKYGQPIYLYSHTGLPYRCYLRSDGLPLSCRRTTPGEETNDALNQYSSLRSLQ